MDREILLLDNLFFNYLENCIWHPSEFIQLFKKEKEKKNLVIIKLW